MLWAVGDNLCGSQLTRGSLAQSQETAVFELPVPADWSFGVVCRALSMQGFHGLVPSCQHSSLHPSSQKGWWGSSLPAGSLTHTSPPFLCVSSPEFLTAGSFNSPIVTPMFCCYEQTLAAEPKSIASSVGREDSAAEEHLNSIPGSLYDLAKK